MVDGMQVFEQLKKDKENQWSTPLIDNNYKPKKEGMDWKWIITCVLIGIGFIGINIAQEHNFSNLQYQHNTFTEKLEILGESDYNLMQGQGVLWQGETALSQQQLILAERDMNEHIILARMIQDLNLKCGSK